MPKRSANAIDKAIGERVRALRQLRRVSQMELGRVLGVTFQQIQKFELGNSRMSASQLYDVAEFLNMPVNRFFPEARKRRKQERLTKPDATAFAALKYLASEEGFKLIRAALALDALERTSLVDYLETLTKKSTMR